MSQYYTNHALGQVVRILRKRVGKTQEQLGQDAGYQAGAGVAISRLENGLLHPDDKKLAGIAKELGMTPDELKAEAARQTAEIGESEHDDAARGASSDGDEARPSTGAKELKDLRKRIEREIEERTAVITSLSEEFNEQHDRARDEFFMRFVEVAARVVGAPQPDPTELEDEDATDPDSLAAYRLKASAGGVATVLAGGAGGAAAGAAVGGVAAYGTFVAVATFGTASTGAAISGLTGVAATNAALAVLGGGTLAAGGAGVAGGTMVLASIVAAPMVILFAGGLVLMAKRNRKQQQELAEQLAEAEAELSAAEPGYRALQRILPQAAETLSYIATHGGHALSRWEGQLDQGELTWQSLNEDDRQRYQGFIEVAAAQLAIVTINVQGVLTTRGEDQDRLIELADEVLEQARQSVSALV